MSKCGKLTSRDRNYLVAFSAKYRPLLASVSFIPFPLPHAPFFRLAKLSKCRSSVFLCSENPQKRLLRRLENARQVQIYLLISAAKLKPGRFPYLEDEARRVSLYGIVPCTRMKNSLELICYPSIFSPSLKV